MEDIPGTVHEGGVNPTSDVVVSQPSQKDPPAHSNVGLEELSKTDRLLVQQLAEYSEAACCCGGYEGENQFEVTDRFGHQIFFAEEDSNCCTRQCCESQRGFDMSLMDRQGKAAIRIERPVRCDNCWLCPCMAQAMTVECPVGQLAGTVEQSMSLFTPTYQILDVDGQERFTIEGPSSLSCCKKVCDCCKTRDVIFRISDSQTGREVGQISKKWSGVLKEVLTTADRFSVDFPPDVGVEMKSLLLAATFLIDYLHFEADPGDEDDEDD